MKTATINIGAMHCASCASMNERNLKKVKGIASASVNYATHSATIEYDEKLADEKQFHTAIEKGGYKVLSNESFEKQKEETAKEMKSSRKKAFIAIALSVQFLF